MAAGAAVYCRGDAKDFERLKMSGSIDIAATAILGISIM